MKRRDCLALLLSAAGLSAPVAAQEYPSRPVQMVVPFPPGGANDILARVLAPSMGAHLKGSVVVDNRAGGAAGSVGALSVANAKPDGYSLLLGNTATMAINASLYPNLRYDPQRDFEPVGMVGTSSLVLVVNSKLPVKNVSEFVQLLKAAPGRHSFASAGAGSPLHLAGELFKIRTGTDMVHVPYRGSAPAYGDLLSGRVSAMFDNTTTAAQHVKAGSIRALAVTGRTRSALFPEVPTLAETGIQDSEVLVWFALVAPSGTDAAILARLNGAVAASLKSEEIRRRLLDLDIEAWGSTPAEARAFIGAEAAKWRGVVQRAGVRVE